MGFIQGMQGCFPISADDVIGHVNKIKVKNNMINSVDAGKQFAEIQHLFMIKKKPQL